MVGAGIIGYAFVKLGFNSAALVLGLVLGQMCESNFRRAYTINNGSIMAMFNSPITSILVAVCIIMLVYPIVKPLLPQRKKATAEAGDETK